MTGFHDDRRLAIAARPSALARSQAEWVRQALAARGFAVEPDLKVIETSGDRTPDRPLPEIGGKGLFTADLEAALRRGEVDLAVHSLKDLPIELPAGICLAAIPEREDPRDVLVSRRYPSLQDLPDGALVGTSSLRRGSQLLALRPGLRIEPIRGNVETRVRKVDDGEFDAAVMAGAGLLRLGLHDRITAWLPFEQMLPAPGQGALAVQCREDDLEALTALRLVDSLPVRRAVEAERAFLEGLGGGCSAPVAAFARSHPALVELEGLVGSLDGAQIVRVRGSGTDPAALGKRLAEEAIRLGAGRLIVHG